MLMGTEFSFLSSEKLGEIFYEKSMRNLEYYRHHENFGYVHLIYYTLTSSDYFFPLSQLGEIFLVSICVMRRVLSRNRE